MCFDNVNLLIALPKTLTKVTVAYFFIKLLLQLQNAKCMKSRLGACPPVRIYWGKEIRVSRQRQSQKSDIWGRLLRLDSLLGEKFVRGRPLFGPKSVDPPSLLRRKCQNLKLFWRKKELKFANFVIECQFLLQKVRE